MCRFVVIQMRMMRYWLIKTEPGTYSWQDLMREKEGTWDGVRNAEARNNLKAMRTGDALLFYHTGNEKAIVGVARVSAEAFPDGESDSTWVAIRIRPVTPFNRPVTLTEIKVSPELCDMPLIRMSRLSVQPVDTAAFRELLRMSGTKLP